MSDIPPESDESRREPDFLWSRPMDPTMADRNRVGTLDDSTVLCGAGISVPSGLPDGQRVARASFELVWRGSKAFGPEARDLVHDALKWSSQREPELRLELMLDLLAHELDPAVLVEIFRVLAPAVPNPNHVALVLSRAKRLVTTNQDMLLEEASRQVGRRRNVLHLHGRLDDPGSIIALLSQYVRGLPMQTKTRLRSSVRGRKVVVVGYSGRDRDVMPLLADADSIVWVHHKSRRRPQAPLAKEVEILRAQFDARFQLEVADTTTFLLDHVSANARRRALGAPTSRAGRVSIPAEVRRHYGALPALAREHSIARLMLHVNAADLALRGAEAARRTYGDNAGSRMLEADSLMALGERSEAVEVYRRAGRLATDAAVRCSALQNQAHALANSSEYTRARRALDRARLEMRRVGDRRRRLQLQGQIAALRGRMRGMTDDEGGAMRDYAHARRAFTVASDLDGLVQATIFGSDMLRSRGRYREALAQLAEIFADSELYSRPYARSWAPFYRGAVLGSMGCIQQGVADLRQAASMSRATNNHQAVAWSEVALANYLREVDLDAADKALDDCKQAIDKYGGPMFQCEVRLKWERAELARGRGDTAEVGAWLTEIRAMLSSRSAPGPLPYMDAHVLAIEGELARGAGDPAAQQLLQEARASYRAGKWAACVARIDVSLWLLRGGPVPKRLLVRCQREGYALEVERLECHKTDPYYPLHTF